MNRKEMLQKLLLGEDPLEVSIKKWQDIVDGKGVDEGSDNCALCEKFRDTGWLHSVCTECPVKVRTGRKLCKHTPYSDYDDYASSLTAQLELDFLKSLRPRPKEAPE